MLKLKIGNICNLNAQISIAVILKLALIIAVLPNHADQNVWIDAELCFVCSFQLVVFIDTSRHVLQAMVELELLQQFTVLPS
jgi:hypothetical protein